MIVHSGVPGNAPNADPVAENDKNLRSDNSSADFSALLFLILATPQVQPVGPQGSDIPVRDGSADSCAPGLCGAVVPVIPGQVEPLGANILANGAVVRENHAAGFQASVANAEVVTDTGVALTVESEAPVATAGQFEPFAGEVSTSLGTGVPSNDFTAAQSVNRATPKIALELSSQVATNPASAAPEAIVNTIPLTVSKVSADMSSAGQLAAPAAPTPAATPAGVTKTLSGDPSVAVTYPDGGVKLAHPLAKQAPEADQLPAQDEIGKVDPLAQKESRAGNAGVGGQGGALAAAEPQPNSAGSDNHREKELLAPHPSAHQLSSSLTTALRGSEGAREAPASAAPLVGRVADEIATQVRQNRNEAILTLDPPELGSLRITITLDGDKVQARIHAETHESGNLIHSHLTELKDALQGHRLDLIDVHIDSGNWNNAGNERSQNFGREFGADHQERGERPAREPASNDVLDASGRHLVATRSGRVSMWA